MSPEDLELEFNPRATVRNVDARVAAYTAASAATRARLDCVLDVRYGSGEKETLDIFPANEPNAPVHLFIHGGYWRAMDKSNYSFIADAFQPAGATTVLVNYDLCPDVTLDTIVAGVRQICEIACYAQTRRSQKSSKRLLSTAQRRAMMALAPATLQRMPPRLRRVPMMCLQPPSTTPVATHRPTARNFG